MRAFPVLAANVLVERETNSLPVSQTLARQTSVVVVAYNSGHSLQDCIASVCLTQPEVKVVVVDNASTDGAVDRVRTEFPSVSVVRSELNAGFGAGSNLGAACTKGAFLVFLNPDAVVTEGWLEALVRPLSEDASVGLVTPKVLLRHDPRRINVAGLNVHLSGISLCRGLLSPRATWNETGDVAAISGAAFAIRRDVFEAIKGFDEDFFLYVEDVDLSARAWLAGYRCLYVPRAVVLHEYELEVGICKTDACKTDACKTDARKTFYVERGRYLMLLKNFCWRTLLALLPTLLLAEVITWGWLLWRNPTAIVQKLRAWRWVLSHRNQLVEKRRQMQTIRVCLDSAFLIRCQWRLDFASLAGPRMARVARIVFEPLLRVAWQIALWLCQ